MNLVLRLINPSIVPLHIHNLLLQLAHLLFLQFGCYRVLTLVLILNADGTRMTLMERMQTDLICSSVLICQIRVIREPCSQAD